jgi:hypothetical protein
MTRPAVRVRKARRPGPLACGHPARIGSQIVNRGHGWICATCAVRLALDAIRTARDDPPRHKARRTAARRTA